MTRALALTLLLAAAATAGVQSAGDYFHDASDKYVAGRQQEAVLEADEGLRKYPADEHLKMLDDLLHRMQKQQRQDENQSGGGQQQQQKQNSKNNQGQGQQQPQNQNQKQNGDQKKQPENQQQKQNQSPQDSSGKKQQPPKEANAAQGDTTGQGQSGQNEKPKPGEMSKADAERLLNSFEDEEKQEQRQRLTPRHPRPEVEQDW